MPKYLGPYDSMYPAGADGPSYFPGQNVPNLSAKRLSELRDAGIRFEDDPVPAPAEPVAGVTPAQAVASEAADGGAAKKS
jgi:hypothetical protein